MNDKNSSTGQLTLWDCMTSCASLRAVGMAMKDIVKALATGEKGSGSNFTTGTCSHYLNFYRKCNDEMKKILEEACDEFESQVPFKLDFMIQGEFTRGSDQGKVWFMQKVVAEKRAKKKISRARMALLRNGMFNRAWWMEWLSEMIENKIKEQKYVNSDAAIKWKKISTEVIWTQKYRMRELQWNPKWL